MSVELHFCGVVTLPECLIKDSGPNVFFHGQVSAARIAEEYRSASVLLFPTLCDGFGMVVAEAFAHGLPVIATPNAGAADLVLPDKNGWLVPPADADALAERMEWCIGHKDALDAMRAHAQETARNWTWGHFRQSFATQLLERLAVANT